MSTSLINVRLDASLKQEAEELFSELGLNMTSAISMFLRQAVRDQAIPFRVCKYPKPNATTIAAMREAERLAHDPNAKSYTNVEDLLKDLKS
ncbi:MAG: type II toxin-antitoxin system RelB/DinJ family antitoxin [Victivallales bacterium]|nr:type II toxin-antitoxin system RelB/DinJ family antitoxin [Victivallales bacterium]MBR5837928.1 type II toxin-antitoxin system RelB/DinJ family antitoxin [Victivallales bacterium]